MAHQNNSVTKQRIKGKDNPTTKNALNIHELLSGIVENVEDLQGIIVTDVDGATISKGFVDELTDKTDDPELASLQYAVQQASKLDFGICSSLMAYYDNCILIHIVSEKETLIMTLICLKTVNMDTICHITDRLETVLNTLETVIDSNVLKK